MLSRRAPKNANLSLPSHRQTNRKLKLPIPIRRRSRGPFIQFLVFLALLLVILYINFPSSRNSSPYAWTKVAYPAGSSALPANGVCEGLSTSTVPALVVARLSNDSDAWLDSPKLRSRYHLCIYTADLELSPGLLGTTTMRTPANRGHEAMAYLTFIIDNYSDLPAAGMVFVHGSRFAWHNDHQVYDNLALLSSLSMTAALEPYGYHNLKCDWAASTCLRDTEPQGSLAMQARRLTEPWNARVVSDASLPGALENLFGGTPNTQGKKQNVKLSRHHTVRSQCCAQFAVSCDMVWQHTKEEYVAIRQWLLDGMIDPPDQNLRQKLPSRRSGAAPPDDRVAGRILSYLWHILFLPHGQEKGIDLAEANIMACPNAQECYCRLYGRCALTGCTEDSCPGQYAVPKGFKLEEGWEQRYG